MTWLANIAYLCAAVVYLPVLVYQMTVQRKNRRGWGERLFGPRHRDRGAPDQRRIWVHAVSLGEINAARGIIASLAESLGDYEIVISTTTDTGYARARELYGRERVFRFPADFSWTIRRTLDRIRPALIVLVELEVWFNMVRLATRRGVPVAVVNGRLTERSHRRLRRLGPLARSMFTRLAWVGAQDEAIAGRFRDLGTPADRVQVTGSVKWDTAQVADRIDRAEDLAAAMGIDRSRPLWVCGSTGPGEETIILDCHRAVRGSFPDAQLAIIPRKPERFDQVAELIRSAGFECVRRSGRPDGSAEADPPASDAVFLGDTMGELRKLYSLADVVFVGRSLVPMGGSDPMEVAALGKPVITGPHMDNFAQPTQALAGGGGLRSVADARELTAAVREVLRDRDLGRKIGAHARQVVVANQGATGRTTSALMNMLDLAGRSSLPGKSKGATPAEG